MLGLRPDVLKKFRTSGKTEKDEHTDGRKDVDTERSNCNPDPVFLSEDTSSYNCCVSSEIPKCINY